MEAGQPWRWPKMLPSARREKSTQSMTGMQAACCFIVLLVRLRAGSTETTSGIHWRLIREGSPLVIYSRIILQRAQF